MNIEKLEKVLREFLYGVKNWRWDSRELDEIIDNCIFQLLESRGDGHDVEEGREDD